MKRAFYIRSLGLSAALGGRLFQKDVLRVGHWIHPVTKQEFRFSRQDLVAIAAETNRLIGAGVKVSFPDETHDVPSAGTASKNLGFWTAFSVVGDELVGIAEAADDEVAKALGTKMRDVSIFLEPETTDSHGKKYGLQSGVITHVCATQYPVIEGQKNFLKLSRSGSAAAESVPVLQEKPMALNAHLVAVAAALSLSTDGIADDAALEAAITAHTKKIDGERASAVAASKTTQAALSSKESETAALSTRLKAIEDASKADDEATRDAEIRATAEACKGKPAAFAADRQARVKALWPKDREGAREVMQLAREAAGVETPVEGKTVSKPASDETAKAKDLFDTRVALAKTAGRRVQLSKDGTKATVTPTSAEASKGAKVETIAL